MPGGHDRVLIQGYAEDKTYCIHAREGHTGLTMRPNKKMRVHAHAEFCLMPTVTIFETTHGGDVLDIAFDNRLILARRGARWSRTSEPTQADNYRLSRGHPELSRLDQRSTHFEHLTVAWLTSKSADPRSERPATLSITDLVSRIRYRSAD